MPNDQKFTLGPWAVGAYNTTEAFRGIEQHVAILQDEGGGVPDGQLLAVVGEVKAKDYAESIANARLIAAAPEMLEVLKALRGHAIRQVRNIAVRECLHCGARRNYGDEEQHRGGCLYANAQALIEKVEDPDYDLELKPETEQALRESLDTPREQLLTADEVRSKLDLYPQQPKTTTPCSGFEPDAICKCGRRIEDHRNIPTPVEETKDDQFF